MGAAVEVASAAELKALEVEAFANLKSLFTAQRAYFAEKDAFSTNLDQVGFQPDEWCEDGARLRITEQPSALKKVGCHFVYEVETTGTGGAMQVRCFARGAVDAAMGLTYFVDSHGDHRGIPRRA